MKKNKQPKFEFSDEDVYEILRTSTTQIAFDYFCNYVIYSAEKKRLPLPLITAMKIAIRRKHMIVIPNKILPLLILQKEMSDSLSILMKNTQLKILFSA